MNLSRHKTGRAAVIGIAMVGLATACKSAPPPVRPADKVLHVDVIGDSLIRQTVNRLGTRLTGFGYTFYIASDPSQAMDSPFVQGALASISSNNGDIVVVATASNDALAEALIASTKDEATAEAAYRKTLGNVYVKFANRCVVIVNARTDVSLVYNPVQAAIVNKNIVDESTNYGNAIITDWATTSHPMPTTYFSPDGLHFGPDPSVEGTLEGANAYANAVVGGVDQCRQMLKPV